MRERGLPARIGGAQIARCCDKSDLARQRDGSFIINVRRPNRRALDTQQPPMEPAKYVHGGEGTLVEDDVVVAVAAIVDDAERKSVLTCAW